MNLKNVLIGVFLLLPWSASGPASQVTITWDYPVVPLRLSGRLPWYPYGASDAAAIGRSLQKFEAVLKRQFSMELPQSASRFTAYPKLRKCRGLRRRCTGFAFPEGRSPSPSMKLSASSVPRALKGAVLWRLGKSFDEIDADFVTWFCAPR